MTYDVTVGIDWGSREHSVCLVRPRASTATGLEHRAWSVPHTPDGLQQLVLALVKHGDRVAVALERPDGVLAETLLEAGIALYHLNPKKLDRFRDRFSVAGAKDDPLDAKVLARSLRTDIDCFELVPTLSAWELELKALTRTEHRISVEITRTSNLIGSCLSRYFPQFLELTSCFTRTTWTLELLKAAPSPRKLALLPEAELARILRRVALTPAEARQRLEKEYTAVSAGTTRAAELELKMLIAQMEQLRTQRKELKGRLAELLECAAAAMPAEPGKECDIAVLRSFPGIGDKVLAGLLAEAPRQLRDRNYRHLRAVAGVAPVTSRTGESGKRRPQVRMRRSCSSRLRFLMHQAARSAARDDPRFRRIYERQRSRGNGDARALRTVADRMLHVLCACLRSGTLYEPSRMAQAA